MLRMSCSVLYLSCSLNYLHMFSVCWAIKSLRFYMWLKRHSQAASWHLEIITHGASDVGASIALQRRPLPELCSVKWTDCAIIHFFFIIRNKIKNTILFSLFLIFLFHTYTSETFTKKYYKVIFIATASILLLISDKPLS